MVLLKGALRSLRVHKQKDGYCVQGHCMPLSQSIHTSPGNTRETPSPRACDIKPKHPAVNKTLRAGLPLQSPGLGSVAFPSIQVMDLRVFQFIHPISIHYTNWNRTDPQPWSVNDETSCFCQETYWRNRTFQSVFLSKKRTGGIVRFKVYSFPRNHIYDCQLSLCWKQRLMEIV